MIGGKKCCRCKEWKSREEFYSSKNRPDGISTQCKPCNNNHSAIWSKKNKSKVNDRQKNRSKKHRDEMNPRFLVMRKLGASREHAKKFGYQPCNSTIDELESKFTTKCQCCGKESGRSIHLDHCHKTGAFRGFICVMCNSILGYAKDNPDTLRLVIKYLEESSIIVIIGRKE